MEKEKTIKKKVDEIVGQLELNNEWGDVVYSITESFPSGQVTYEVVCLMAETGQIFDIEAILFSDLCCAINRRDSILKTLMLSKIREINNTCNIKDKSQNIKIILENGYININTVIKFTK